MKSIHIVLFMLFISATSAIRTEQSTKKTSSVCATIFIHGTTKPWLSLKNIATIWKRTISQSSYETLTRYFREHQFFKVSQAMQDIGLQKIYLSDIHTGSGASAVANVMDYINNTIAPNNKYFYYTFGWTGLLSKKARYKAAQQLYNSLVQLRNQAKRNNIDLKIRLIGYSHGGTTALNLALAEKKYNKHLIVDELVLLGMPVQQDTDHLVQNNIFKKIYHFYSMADIVQRLDHVSSDFFSCHRQFSSRKDFILPDTLTQAEIQVTKAIKKTTIDTRTFHLNPTHCELWSFGWNPKGYRKSLALYPFPVVVFIPYMIEAINKLPTNEQQHVIVDIKPTKHHIEVRPIKRLHKPKSIILPIFDYKIFTTIGNTLQELFNPFKKTLQDYRSFIKNGLRQTFTQHNCCTIS